MLNVNLAQKLKDLFFGQPGNSKSIKNANINPPSDAEIIALLSSAGEPYKVITGILSGHATTPTFALLQNELDATISSISRNGAGDYDINISANGFTANKTVILGTCQGGNYLVQGSRKDANSVQIKVLGLSETAPAITDPTITADPLEMVNPVITGGVASWAGIDNSVTFVEIRVYNS